MNNLSGYRCYACKAPLRPGWACDNCGSTEAEDVPVDENPPMPMSNKEKQAEFRKRQAEQGLQEVRGVFLPPELHTDLKVYALKMLAKHQKAQSRKIPADPSSS